jgi:hypothetical protein
MCGYRHLFLFAFPPLSFLFAAEAEKNVKSWAVKRRGQWVVTLYNMQILSFK